MLRIVARRNPLDSELVFCDIDAGPSLAEIIGAQTRGVHASVNGVVVPEAAWASTFPQDGELVVLVVVPQFFGIDIAIASAMAAAVSAANGVLGAVVAALGTTATIGGVSLGVTWGTLALGVLSVASSAIGMLIRPQMPTLQSSGNVSNRFSSLTSGSNQASPFGIIPKLYGTLHVTPPLAGNYYTSIVSGDNQRLHALFCLGHGPLKIGTHIIGPSSIPGAVQYIDSDSFEPEALTDIMIGDTPISDVRGERWELGTAEAIMGSEKTIYTSDIEEKQLGYVFGLGFEAFGAGQTWSGAWHYPSNAEHIITWEDTTGENPEVISFDFLIPALYCVVNRSPAPVTVSGAVRIAVHYKRQGTPDSEYKPVTLLNGNVSGQPHVWMLGKENDWPIQSPQRRTNEFRVRNRNTNTDPWTATLGEAAPDQKYTVRIRRVATYMYENLGSIVSDITWTGLRTEKSTPAWNVDAYLGAKDVILLGLRVTATDQLSGTLPPLTVRAQSVLPTWNDGAFTWQPTSNPAWIYADILRGQQVAPQSRVADDQINWADLKDWADYCDGDGDTSDTAKVFTYNWYHTEDETMLDRLRAVATTGRAAWALVDSQFTVVRDNRFYPVQLISPRNSRNFEFTKTWPKIPHALRVRWFNPATGNQDETIVLMDGYFTLDAAGKRRDAFGFDIDSYLDYQNAGWTVEETLVYINSYTWVAATLYETIETQGVTNKTQAWREGRYYLATLKLRPEIFKVEMDFENLVATRGDCVLLSHDVLLRGRSFGRIKAVDGRTLTLDESVEIFGSEVPALRIRRGGAVDNDTGAVSGVVSPTSQDYLKLYDLVMPAAPEGSSGTDWVVETRTVTLTEDATVHPGDLFAYGPKGTETVLAKITQVDYQADLSATVTMVAAAPGIATADEGPIQDDGSSEPGPPPRVKVPTPTGFQLLSDARDLQKTAEGWVAKVMALWTIPPTTAIVERVRLYYSIAGEDDWTMREYPATTLSGEITGVPADTLFQAYLIAYGNTDTGAGQYSEPTATLQITTPGLSLGVPSDLALADGSYRDDAGTLLYAFQASWTVTGSYEGSEVQWQREDTPTPEIWDGAPVSSSLSHTVSGLAEGVYRVRVRTYNAFGDRSAWVEGTIHLFIVWVEIQPAQPYVGLDVTLRAGVTAPGATGTITFVLDDVGLTPPDTLSGGIAERVKSWGTTGSHQLKAVYSGDSNHPGKQSGLLSFSVVGRVATITTLSVSPLTPKDGDDITLTVVVTGNAPTGTVTITWGLAESVTLTLVDGSAAHTITGGLTVGTYTFTAQYAGDSFNLPSTSNSVTIEVGSSWAGRPAPPSNLSARGDMWAVYLDWINPFIGDYAHTEVWASDTITTFDATTYDAIAPPTGVTKVAEVTGSSFTFLRWNNADLVAGQTYYFWVRNVDKESLYSTWVPVGNGAAATVLSDPGRYLDILTGSITETQLYSSLGSKIDLIVPLDSRVNTAETDIISLQNEDVNLYAQLSLVSAGATGFDTAKIWHFDASSDITGWTVTNASALSVSGGLLTFTPTAADSSFSTGTISVSGSAYQVVKLRIKRVSGAEGTDWIGRLTYYYNSTSSSLTISEPTYDSNGWATAEWDLSTEANWTGNTIIKLQVALGNATSMPWGGVFKADWMAVGRNAPSASVAQVADLSVAQIGYCVVGGSPSSHESKSACEAAGGTWYGNLPLAQAVKQVSVTDGVSTGTIEQKFTAQKTNLDTLNLQYSVKIDNDGYVSGFGLASTPVNGVPYSDFMVRADRFSIVSPNIPSLRAQISGSLTHNGTTATVTTASTHPFAVDDTVVLSNVANAYWNRTFKVTAKTGTTFSFAVHASNPLCLHPDAAASTTAAAGKTAYALKTTLPFVVLTTTDSNGTPPGVYMAEAYMKYAAITRLHVKDGEMVNAKIGNALYSNNWPVTGDVPATHPPVGSAFNGWILDKVNGLRLYGNGFALYDANQNPIIEAGGVINGSKFKRLVLTATAEVFAIPKPPATAVTPATITVNATAQNLTGLTISWSVTSGAYTGTLNNGVSSQTINPTNMTTPVLTLRAWVTDAYSTVYEDFITLAKVQEGADSVYLYLSNESDSLTATASGSLTGATSVVSEVKVYRGTVDVTTSEGWAIAVTSSDANTSASYSAGTVTVTMANNSADRVAVTITATRIGSPTQTRVMTVVKQRQGVQGEPGGAGTRTAILDMYRWGASAPTTFPSGTSTYTWATGQFTAPATPNGWSLTPPAAVAGQTLWIARTVYSDNATSATSSVTWAATTARSVGAAGSNGQNGYRTAVLELYRWAATAPTTFPSGSSTYTWATGAFTSPATLNGWALTPGAPVPGQTLWGCSVTFADQGTSATSAVTWNTSTAYAIGGAGSNGVDGTNGYNTATLTAYKRAASAPADNPGTLTYTFATAAWTPANGWSKAIPAGTDPIWATVASAYSNTTTDSIASTDWAAPVKVAESGTDGADGLTIATVYIYRRTTTNSAPALPSVAATYTFATASLAGLNNSWTTTVPGAASGGYLWVSTATAVATAGTATDTIPSTEWAAATLMAQDGTDAKALSLLSNAYVRQRGKTGTVSPTSIVLTAQNANLTGSPIWYYWFPKKATAPRTFAEAKSGNYKLTGSAATYTLNANQTTGEGWYPADPAFGVGVVWDGLEDGVEMYDVTEGSDAITVVLSNEAHVLPASTAGAVSSYTGSGTTIQVYAGATLLDHDGSGTNNGTWKVASPAAGTVGNGSNGATNITVGTYSTGGASPSRYITVGQHSGVAAGTDTSSITYTLTGKSPSGAAFSITKTQSFSKAKTGATGADGTPGASAYSMILSNESHTLPAKADGTVISYSGAACTATVYLGVAPDTGWSFAGSPASSGTLTYTKSGGTFTITGMAAGTDAAYIDITASKSGQSSITRRFSISKSKTGQTVSVSASTQLIKGTVPASPASFILTATTTGSQSNLIWEYNDDQGSSPTQTWKSSDANLNGKVGWILPTYIGAPAPSNPDPTNYYVWGSFPEYNSVMRFRCRDTVTGASDVVTVSRVVDGATGSRGAGWYYATGSSWNDATANAATPGDNQIADAVTISNGSTFSETRVWDGTSWLPYGTRLNGNVFINGTVIAEKLAGGTITGKNIYLSGGTIRTLNYSAGNTGWKIDGNGDAEFNTVIIRKPSKTIQSGVLSKQGGVYAADNVTVPTGTGVTTIAEHLYQYTNDIQSKVILSISASFECPEDLVLVGIFYDTYIYAGSYGWFTESVYPYYRGTGQPINCRHFSATFTVELLVPPSKESWIRVKVRHDHTGNRTFGDRILAIHETYA